jgi:hypothetical protein
MSMNIFDPPEGAYWGKFNDRIIDQEWVDDLANQYPTNLQNCTDKDAIEIGVKKEWIQNIEKIVRSVEGKKVEGVPLIEFLETGKAQIANKNLWCFGGNHRREALRIHVEKLEKELKKIKEEILAIEAGTGGQDTQEEIASLKSAAEKLTERIHVDKHWVIRLYDRGASD